MQTAITLKKHQRLVNLSDACRVSGASTSTDCKKYKEACSKYVNFKRVFPSEFAAAEKSDYLMN